MPPSCKNENKNGRRVYLITYSQANTTRFQDRKDFAKFVAAAFNNTGGSVKVQYLAVCKEPHANGGEHYHCSLKLTGTRRWSVPYKWMVNNGVIVDISDQHEYYVNCFRYVCKEDDKVYMTSNHPDLNTISSPRTKSCIQANRRRVAQRNQNQQQQQQQQQHQQQQQQHEQPQPAYRPRSRNMKLSNLDVGELVTRRNISTTKELYALAEARKRDGECDLAIYMMDHREANIKETIQKAWMFPNAAKEITEESKTRLERLEEAYNGPCVVDGCQWLRRAKEVLDLNKISIPVFTKALYDCLYYGRQKFRNIMLVGRSNTAKTFMLRPLKNVFGDYLFENPSRDRFCWGPIQHAQVCVLQDFRYSKDQIVWGDLLLLLEGQTVNLVTPKSFNAADIKLGSDNDIPILATSIKKIEYSRFSPDFERETEMMDSRWNIFEFTHRFEGEGRIEMEPCGRCFAKFITSR